MEAVSASSVATNNTSVNSTFSDKRLSNSGPISETEFNSTQHRLSVRSLARTFELHSLVNTSNQTTAQLFCQAWDQQSGVKRNSRIVPPPTAPKPTSRKYSNSTTPIELTSLQTNQENQGSKIPKTRFLTSIPLPQTDSIHTTNNNEKTHPNDDEVYVDIFPEKRLSTHCIQNQGTNDEYETISLTDTLVKKPSSSKANIKEIDDSEIYEFVSFPRYESSAVTSGQQLTLTRPSLNSDILAGPAHVQFSYTSSVSLPDYMDEIGEEVDEMYDDPSYAAIRQEQSLGSTKSTNQWVLRRTSVVHPSESEDDTTWEDSSDEEIPPSINGVSPSILTLNKPTTLHVPSKQTDLSKKASTFSATLRSSINVFKKQAKSPLSLPQTCETHPSKSELQKSTEENYFIPININDDKHPPAHLPPEPPEGMTAIQAKARHIVESIASTENSYVASLKVLLDDYEKPLRALADAGNCNFITEKQIDILFYKLREIHQCHRIFQIELANWVSKWDQEESIGSCFVAAFSRNFVTDIYRAFIENFSRLQEVFKQLASKKKGLSAFFKQQHAHSKDPLTFDGLIVKPIQRFPQFKMLLHDLSKYTPLHHHDRLPIQKAITVVEALATLLNDCKRDREQKHEANLVLRQLQLRFHPREIRDKVRLISRTHVTANFYDSEDQLIHQRPQELVLFNNVLVVMEAQNNTATSNQRYWVKPLNRLSLTHTNVTPDMRIKMIASQKGHQTLIQSMANAEISREARKIYDDLQSLMHDFLIVSQTSALVSSLTYSYDALSSDDIQRTAMNLKLAIQQKEDELRLLECSTMTLLVYNKNGSRKRSCTFELTSARAKQEWINQFTRARLASRPDNQSAWYIASDGNTSISPMLQLRMPLFIQPIAAFGMTPSSLLSSPKNPDSTDIVCAIPMCLAYGSIVKRHLWCCSVNGRVSIISIYNETPHLAESFAIDCDRNDKLTRVGANTIVCAELVPGYPNAAEATFQTDMVWHGTDTGTIYLYSLMEGYRNRAVLHFDAMASVRCMCYVHQDHVYTGLENGHIAIYRRSEYSSGFWDTQNPETRQLGYGPVVKIIEYHGRLYIACDTTIYVIETQFHEDVCRGVVGNEPHIDTDKEDDKQHTMSSNAIIDFTVYGHGVWVAFTNSTVLQLWNIDFDVHLQDMNLTTVLQSAGLRFISNKYSSTGHNDSVTRLKATRNCLWVGTNNGWLCGLPLPGMENCVPQGQGRPYVSCHAHRGPVRAIVSYQNTMERVVQSVTVGIQKDFLKEAAHSTSMKTGETMQRPVIARIQTEISQQDDQQHISIQATKNKWLSMPNLLDMMENQDKTDNQETVPEDIEIKDHAKHATRLSQANLDLEPEDEYEFLNNAPSQLNAVQQTVSDDSGSSSIGTLSNCTGTTISAECIARKNSMAKAQEEADKMAKEHEEENAAALAEAKKKAEHGRSGSNLIVTLGQGYVNYSDENTVQNSTRWQHEACLLCWYE